MQDLPENVPEAYFAYIEQVDRARRSIEPDGRELIGQLRAAAALIAFVELGSDFRPKAVERTLIEAAIQADRRFAATKISFVRRLLDDGLLVSRHVGAVEMIEYVLDPVAECLAAFEHVRRCGADCERWAQLLKEVAAHGESAWGFELALRMNYAAYAEPLQLPLVRFASVDGRRSANG